MEFNLKQALEEYRPNDKLEKIGLEKTKEFLLENNNCFDRSNLEGHIVAGAMIIDKEGNVLRNHHKFLNKWLHFGGHSDGEEDSLSVAKREVEEEAGMTLPSNFAVEIEMIFSLE
jgi:hypothetical protein